MRPSPWFIRTLLSAGLLFAGSTVVPVQGQSPRGGGTCPQGASGQDSQGQRPQGPNPQQMASLLVQRFDSSGDQALNAQELAQALIFLHENRPGGNNQRGPRGQRQGHQLPAS